MPRQHGSASLLTVVMLLLMGTLLLNATRRQLNENLLLVRDEQIYIRQFTQASSALAWGERLRWSAQAGWQCQYQSEWQWRACLYRSGQKLLLRADGGVNSLSLWRWVTQRPEGRIRALAHGWLDFCPLQEEVQCENSVPAGKQPDRDADRVAAVQPEF